MATKKPLMGQGCVAVVDPGEGSGGAAFPYFWTKLRPKGPKKNGGETGPSPLISGSGSGTVLLWWRKTKLRPEGPKKNWGETGPSPLISRFGSGTVLLRWRKTKWQNIYFNAFHD